MVDCVLEQSVCVKVDNIDCVLEQSVCVRVDNIDCVLKQSVCVRVDNIELKSQGRGLCLACSSILSW